MPIENTQLATYCNETVRPLADDLCQLVHRLWAAKAQYFAQGIDEIIAGLDPAEQIVDGSPDDGRPPLTVGQLLAVLSESSTLIAQFEANNWTLRDVFLCIAVNPWRYGAIEG